MQWFIGSRRISIVQKPQLALIWPFYAAMATNNTSPKGNRLKSISGKLLNSPIGQKLKKRNQSSSVVADSMDPSTHGVQLNAFDTVSQTRQTQVIVAIDFGTTYSGYAYAFRSSPEDIHLMRHPEGGQAVGTVSYKIPTILLLNGQGEFHSFGYEARETYHNLDAEESRKWFYFEKFKMELHSRKVCKNFFIVNVQGDFLLSFSQLIRN